MLSINTNLSSLIAQNSMNKSTNALNLAIERMTTGFKINHTKDNAANYSISTNMTTKINSYMVAEDNVAMGLDMLTTASENLFQIEDKLSRLRALATQSSNGTYGANSQSAINSEANAITDEIERLFKTAEYNSIKLFDNGKASLTGDMPRAGADGFIKQVQKQDTSSLTKLSTASFSSDLADGIYSISTANELAQLAQMTNDGFISEGDTFVLANDIDLAQWCTDHAGDGGWTPIGNNTNKFLGKFDGNGYKISNLKINRSGVFQGLFGRIDGNSIISNLGVTNVDIQSDSYCVGAIVGGATTSLNTSIINCYSSGTIVSEGDSCGGIAGQGTNIINSYSTCDVTGSLDAIGGLVGLLVNDCELQNCYAIGNIVGSDKNGGLVGQSKERVIIENCYAKGCVTSTATTNGQAGGLVGYFEGGSIKNCHSTGDVVGSDRNGGLVGQAEEVYIIENCYAKGNIEGRDYIGGLIGYFEGGTIKNCHAVGNVQGMGYWIGGLIGVNDSTGSSIIEKCYAIGDVRGDLVVGGLIGGYNTGAVTVMSSYCTGNVSGNENVGGLLGYVNSTSSASFENCYTKSCVLGDGNDVSGFIGYVGGLTPNVTLSNCSVLGTIGNNDSVILGCYNTSSLNSIAIEDCRYNSQLINNGNALVRNSSAIGYLDITNDTIRNAVSTCGFITPFDFSNDINISLQVGIDSSQNSRITMKTNLILDDLILIRHIGQSNIDIIKTIDYMLETVSTKQVELGAVQNRLDSALDEISTQHENLVSSRSTLRDADIAEVSSEYIRQQILQQASATLMATTNQAPAIALQLI